MEEMIRSSALFWPAVWLNAKVRVSIFNKRRVTKAVYQSHLDVCLDVGADIGFWCCGPQLWFWFWQNNPIIVVANQNIYMNLLRYHQPKRKLT